MTRSTRLLLGAGLVGLLVLLALGLTRDPGSIPSPLIGKPLPALAGTTLDGQPQTLAGSGRPMVVNVWASWCLPCLDEHPVLMEGARRWSDRVEFVGLAYRDAPEAVRDWLGRHGNPFSRVVLDPNGRAGIELGVYGVPETFFVDAGGRIVHKHVGALSAAALERQLSTLLAEHG